MTEPQSFESFRFVDKYQPHWVWMIAFVLVPLILVTIGFLGIEVGSFIPFSVASNAPKVAVGLSLFGMGAALARRHRIPIGIAGIGTTISLAGFLMLWWAGR